MLTALVLTSTFLRHHHVANVIAPPPSRCARVGREEKSFVPERYATTDEEPRVVAAHFEARDRAETRDFAADAELRMLPDATARCF